jgi:histone deacetylase complex subunit SAP18
MATITSNEDTNGSTGKVAMDMELDDAPDPKRGNTGRKVQEKTLDGYGFITGDLISVSLFVPEAKIPVGIPRGGVPLTLGGQGGGGGGIGNGNGAGPGMSSFGWGDRGNPGLPKDGPVDKDGTWSRGEALPPQGFRGGRGGLRGGREEGRGGMGMGIRGGGRRSPEGRDRDRERGDGRSRSPDARDSRRVSWNRR